VRVFLYAILCAACTTGTNSTDDLGTRTVVSDLSTPANSDLADDLAGGDLAGDCTQQPVVHFSTDVHPILANCGGELCHGGFSISPWPYSSLVNQLTNECQDGRMIVLPGHPESSYLIQKLTNTDLCSGVAMPKLGQPLSAAKIATIQTWICQGAANN
jgi:hypothetical protein